MSGNRRALLITPSFFGYERDIADAMKKSGWEIDLMDERPSNSSLIRAAIRARPSLVHRRVDKHYAKCAGRLRVPYELVVVIKAEVVPRWFLEEVRRLSPDARFIFYAYDSVANAPHSVEVLDVFDRLFSFDHDDVDRYPGLEYMPLFYGPEFDFEGRESLKARDLSVAFVGTVHSDRYQFVKSLTSGVAGTYIFFFVQAPWYFALGKYLLGTFKGIRWKEVSFVPMTKAQVADIFRRSLVVLDLQRTGQSGLTMRTFEAVASGATLVTTNAGIVREPFYDPARMIVVSSPPLAEERQKIERLLRLEPSGPPPGFEAYSLDSWVRKLTGS